MKLEIYPSSAQLQFYEDDGKYLGSLDFIIMGSRAIGKNLDAKGVFYKNFSEVWNLLELEFGVTVWNAHITPDHLELAVKKLKTHKIDLLAVDLHSNRDLCWIEVTRIA